LLVRVLAGGRVNEEGNLVPMDAQELRSAWNEWRRSASASGALLEQPQP
jgi:hypothetical protein